jgi:hypothetical protein
MADLYAQRLVVLTRRGAPIIPFWVGLSYGSCSSLRLRQLVRVGVPALVGLAGVILVAASPEGPCGAVGLVAAGPGDDGAAELSEQFGNGDGDQFQGGGAAVTNALPGGGDGQEGRGEQADGGPAVPGGPRGDLAAVQAGDLLGHLVIFLGFQRATATSISFASGTGCGLQHR